MTSNAVEDREAPLVARPLPVPSRGQVAVGVLVLAAGVGAALYGWQWWNEGRFHEETEDAYVGGDITVVAAKVPGYIGKVAVADNQQVHAGDLLVKLDDRDYRAALAKADAGIAAQRALLANLGATASLQQAVIAQASASIAATDAETKRAHGDQLRYQDLASKAMVSQQSTQRADAQYAEALAAGRKAQAVQLASTRELDVIATRRLQAEAALAQAVAERELVRLNLAYTEVRAPVDGVIGNRHAQGGAYAASGTQLMSIVPARGLWVDANFKESQLAGIRPGQAATLEADSLPGHRFRGHVVSLAPATGAQFSVLPPENATGNFTKIVQRVPVRIAIEQADAATSALRPGVSVRATVALR